MIANPPRLARSLLRLSLPPGIDRASITGDLQQEYSEMIGGGTAAGVADRWYWRQVLGSIGPLVIYRLARPVGRMASATLLGGGVFIVSFVAAIGTTVALLSVAHLPWMLRLLCYLAALFGSAALGARVARRVSGRNHLPVTTVLGVLTVLAVSIAFAVSPEREPVAAWILWSVVAVVGTATGARGRLIAG